MYQTIMIYYRRRGGLDMTGSEIVTEVMHRSQINQTQLAKLVGFKNQSNVSEALKRDIKISVFQRMIDALGYEVVIQKKKPGKRPEGQIVLGDESK